MKKSLMAMIVVLGLTAACVPYANDSLPGSATSVGSASSLGNNGFLLALLGLGMLLLIGSDSNDSGGGYGGGGSSS